MSIPPCLQVTGLILAGGRGSRMGSADKGLQLFRGAPMTRHVLARLAPQVGPIFISANRNLDHYQGFGLPVYPDEFDDFAGPLAGLQSGMLHCQTPYLVCVPCDSPDLPVDLVKRLSEALVVNRADLARVATESGAGDARRRQPHPVFCLLKTSLLANLSAYMNDGGRKVHAWQATLKVVDVNFEDEAAFRNFNTLEQLQQCERT